MKYLKYSAIFFLFGLLSCDLGKDPAIEGTKVQAMAGEWFILVMSGGKDVGGGYHMIRTSNTAANTDSDLLFDDLETWPAKIVAKVSLPGLTFNAAPNLANMYNAAIKVSVIEGKVLKNLATTPGGNKTDSIYVKMEFSDDPGTQYEYAGYRRTGFQEDEQ